MHIRKNDTVQVISGDFGGARVSEKSRGARGRVLRVLPEKKKVVVEGVAVARKAVRPNPRKGHRGGFIEKELPIAASKVMLVCRNCDRPVRVGFRREDNKKVRYCKKCGQEV
ncbi:MAG TPA: 50S ribosomal protein L24 [Planctomycetes bacterium]|nr:50S ribosomal protein L24 [Planctomycetota bacterium]